MPGFLYHVIVLGIERRDIFADAATTSVAPADHENSAS
jgi:hypothetical protein